MGSVGKYTDTVVHTLPVIGITFPHLKMYEVHCECVCLEAPLGKVLVQAGSTPAVKLYAQLQFRSQCLRTRTRTLCGVFPLVCLDIFLYCFLKALAMFFFFPMPKKLFWKERL